MPQIYFPLIANIPTTERRIKIVLIGTTGFNSRTENSEIFCYPWKDIISLKNIADFDTIIINLLELEKDSIDWKSFFNIMHLSSVFKLLSGQHEIIVLGDPRLQMESPKSMFLDWTGLQFRWENKPGDIVEDQNDRDELGTYLSNLRRWDYSILDVTPARGGDGIYELFRHSTSGPARDGYLVVDLKKHLVNKSGEGIAFSVRLNHQPSHGYPKPYPGRLTFLPATGLSADKTIAMILRDVCGVAVDVPAPEWLSSFIVPGQEPILEEMEKLKIIIYESKTQLGLKEIVLEELQSCRELLFQRDDAFERKVREILRALGAYVEDPVEKNKEDGWIKYTLSGNLVLEFVLEAKSTKKPQLSEEGLKQLLDWKNRGLVNRKKKYKGLLVSINMPDLAPNLRADPFSQSWKETAELSELVAITASDLYEILIRDKKGELDRDAFWQKLHNTNGIFRP